MALSLKDNFKLSVNKPNFDRDIYATKADMKAVKGTRMPQMFIASCLEDGKVYLYNKSNEDDPDTGKWRVLTGASAAPAGDGQTITIDTSVTETSENPVSSKAIWAAIEAVKNAGGNYATKAELNTVKTAFNNLVAYKNADDSNLAAEVTTRAGKDAEGAEKAKGSEAVLQAYSSADTEQYAKITAGMNPDTKKPFTSLLASENGKYAGIEANSDTVTVFGNLQNSSKKAYATKEDVSAEVAKIVANAPAAYDTLKEVSDWISTHETSAAAMNTAIQAKADKSALSSYATTASLNNYATKASLSSYATKAELTTGLSTIDKGTAAVSVEVGKVWKSQSVGYYLMHNFVVLSDGTLVFSGCNSLNSGNTAYCLVSENGGDSWSAYTLAVNSTLGELYAVSDDLILSGGNVGDGSGNGVGIRYSTDKGKTWTKSNGITEGNWYFAASSADKKIVVAVNPNGKGIRYSVDGGKSWQNSNNTAGTFKAVVYSKGVFAAFGGGGGTQGVYISTDNGKNWSQTSRNAEGLYSYSVFVTKKGTVLYSSVTTGSPSQQTGCWRSEDGGKTWIQTNLTNKCIQYITELSDGTLVTSSYYSEDDGKTWKDTNFSGKGYGFCPIVASPENPSELFLYYVPGAAIYKSTDKGKNWSELVKVSTGKLYSSGKIIFGLGSSLGSVFFKSSASLEIASVDDSGALSLGVGPGQLMKLGSLSFIPLSGGYSSGSELESMVSRLGVTKESGKTARIIGTVRNNNTDLVNPTLKYAGTQYGTQSLQLNASSGAAGIAISNFTASGFLCLDASSV